MTDDSAPETGADAEPAPQIAASKRRGVSTMRWRAGAAAGIWLATALVFLLSWGLEPNSVSRSSLLGMLPFAAILAVVAAGQTLVIQQGGIDLSVPGMISLLTVILIRHPNGDNSKLWSAMLLALGAALIAGFVNGFLVSRVRITPIVTTLGMNAVLFGFVIGISGGTPRDSTRLLQDLIAKRFLGIPRSAIIAVIVVATVGFLVKRTVVGRRFEAVGADKAAARASGLEPAHYEIAAYMSAAVLYWAGSVLLAGIVRTPSAFQGNTYLLPSVAAVVLGGTSLLGGVGSVVSTAAGALFITQLEQLVLTSGVNTAVSRLIQAGAIAAGVAIHGWRRDRVSQTARDITPAVQQELVPAHTAPEG